MTKWLHKYDRFFLLSTLLWATIACSTTGSTPVQDKVDAPQDQSETVEPVQMPEIESEESEVPSPAEDTSSSDTSPDSIPTDNEAVDPVAPENTPATAGEPTLPDTSVICMWDAIFPYATTGSSLAASLPSTYEPSGAAWHTRLEKLFVVSDEGLLSMMNDEGTEVTTWSLGGDLEAVAIADPDSDFIYVGVEHPDAIVEFDISRDQITRTFSLTTWMTGDSNSGLEALAFVPDATDPEGGLFYAGHQGEGQIYVFRLPIESSATSTAVALVDRFVPDAGLTDLAALDYDSTSETLFAVYDAANTVLLLEASGVQKEEWTLPGLDQEGFAILPNCAIIVAQDSGDVLLYE